jgi:hypothetical protein
MSIAIIRMSSSLHFTFIDNYSQKRLYIYMTHLRKWKRIEWINMCTVLIGSKTLNRFSFFSLTCIFIFRWCILHTKQTSNIFLLRMLIKERIKKKWVTTFSMSIWVFNLDTFIVLSFKNAYYASIIEDKDVNIYQIYTCDTINDQ